MNEKLLFLPIKGDVSLLTEGVKTAKLNNQLRMKKHYFSLLREMSAC